MRSRTDEEVRNCINMLLHFVGSKRKIDLFMAHLYAATQMSHPQEFVCPVSLSLMRDPVVGPDGHTYERHAITAWLSTNPVSPMTREPMTIGQLKPNYALRASIERYVSGGTIPMVSTISLPAAATGEILLIAVIDTSGSMAESATQDSDAEGLNFTRLQLVKHSLHTVAGICATVPGTQLALINFDSAARRALPTTPVTSTTLPHIDAAIDQLNAGGATNVWDGLRVALDEIRGVRMGNPNLPVHILLLTDGEPTQSMIPPQGIQGALRASLSSLQNVSVSSFGFGYSLDSDLLVQLSEVGKGIFGYIPDCSMVATVFINYCSDRLSKADKQSLTAEEQDLMTMVVEVLKGVTKANRHVNWGPIVDALSLSTCPLAQALLEDIDHASEHKGQLTKALSRDDWFRSWGYNHILAYRRALEQTVCVNFKDQAVQRFSSLRFKEIQSEGNAIFAQLPPPIPQGHTAASLATTNFSMTIFNTADGGCFSGDNTVRMADDSFIFVHQILKGDLVWTPEGPATVVAVIKRRVGRPIKMCKFPGGLLITPWHPVRASGDKSWVFPCLWLGKVDHYRMECFYDFVLDKHHVVEINATEVLTLGHGFQEPVAKHEYYGTTAVLNDLRKEEGWAKGFVEL